MVKPSLFSPLSIPVFLVLSRELIPTAPFELEAALLPLALPLLFALHGYPEAEIWLNQYFYFKSLNLLLSDVRHDLMELIS